MDQHVYWPRLSADGLRPAESREEYVGRIRPLLPNLPADVTGQCFYDHYAQIDHYAWLDFSSLRFELVKWSLPELLDKARLPSPKAFARAYSIRKSWDAYGPKWFHEEDDLGRIVQYFLFHRTWPCPIVVLSNPENRLEAPPGRHCSFPFHLWEGHFRLGVLRGLHERIEMAPEHEVWVGRKE